jgi:hypothetical protein
MTENGYLKEQSIPSTHKPTDTHRASIETSMDRNAVIPEDVQPIDLQLNEEFVKPKRTRTRGEYRRYQMLEMLCEEKIETNTPFQGTFSQFDDEIYRMFKYECDLINVMRRRDGVKDATLKYIVHNDDFKNLSGAGKIEKEVVLDLIGVMPNIYRVRIPTLDLAVDVDAA